MVPITNHIINTSSEKSKRTPLRHLAVIMDGNGRWARNKSLNRVKGHLAGIEAAKQTLISAIEHDISIVTLFVFSTENWNRPKQEVEFILGMVAGKLRSHYQFYNEHNIKVVHSGDLQQLSQKILKELNTVMTETASHTTLTLNIAFNYGGKNELIRAVNRYIQDNAQIIKQTDTELPPLDEQTLEKYFDRPELPAVDLLIRTGGQKRISNFLIWQLAYAELFFSDVLWPNWSAEHMEEAVSFYYRQERRFGEILDRSR